jgi:hypothetical protein
VDLWISKVRVAPIPSLCSLWLNPCVSLLAVPEALQLCHAGKLVPIGPTSPHHLAAAKEFPPKERLNRHISRADTFDYTLAVILLGLGSFLPALARVPEAGSLGGLFVLGLFRFGWLANFMSS